MHIEPACALPLMANGTATVGTTPSEVGLYQFPAIVDAALRIKAQSFLIDGEAVIARDDGTPDFHALRSRRRGCTPST